MYPRLAEYIERTGIPRAAYAKELSLTAEQFERKLRGENEFTLSEAERLRDLTGATIPLAELFRRGKAQ